MYPEASKPSRPVEGSRKHRSRQEERREHERILQLDPARPQVAAEYHNSVISDFTSNPKGKAPSSSNTHGHGRSESRTRDTIPVQQPRGPSRNEEQYIRDGYTSEVPRNSSRDYERRASEANRRQRAHQTELEDLERRLKDQLTLLEGAKSRLQEETRDLEERKSRLKAREREHNRRVAEQASREQERDADADSFTSVARQNVNNTFQKAVECPLCFDIL